MNSWEKIWENHVDWFKLSAHDKHRRHIKLEAEERAMIERFKLPTDFDIKWRRFKVVK